jgi:hypothetical protein
VQSTRKPKTRFSEQKVVSYLGDKGGGLSLEGIGLGATARARLRPECPKIHLRPAAAATEDLARAWRTPCQEGATSCPLDLLLAVLRQGLLALVDDKDLLTIV